LPAPVTFGIELPNHRNALQKQRQLINRSAYLYQFFVERDQAPIRLNGINMLAAWFVLGFWNSVGDDPNVSTVTFTSG